MFLKSISFLFIFVLIDLQAKEITVISRNANYNLTIDKNENISLKGHLINLNMKKNKCNSHIVFDFGEKIEKIINTGFVSKKKGKIFFKTVLNGKIYYESYSSKRGQAFLKIPREMQRMKIEENILCDRPKKSHHKGIRQYFDRLFK